jgi:hypothetical protein
LTACSVTQGFREIGIRVAPGARSADVLGPVIKVGAPLLLAGLALAACYVPARKSLRIDPLAALRQE